MALEPGEWHDTSNEYIGKVYEALGRLTGGSRDGFGIVVFTPLDDVPESSRERFRLSWKR